jgi:hypothetical protein
MKILLLDIPLHPNVSFFNSFFKILLRESFALLVSPLNQEGRQFYSPLKNTQLVYFIKI